MWPRMNNWPVTWALVVPLVAVALVAALGAARNTKRLPDRAKGWIDLAMLVVASGGLLVEAILLATASGAVTLSTGLRFSISPASRLVLLAANASLLCALFFSWHNNQAKARASLRSEGVATLRSPLLASALLAGALLVDNRLVAVLCLMLAALVVSATTLAGPVVAPDDDEGAAQPDLARRLAGGLKHLSLASLGTGLLVAGALLLSRYGLNLDNKGLLQLGLGLLAVGLMVRAGAMPFSAAAADMVESSPASAIIMLGAATPIVLAAGLLMFGSVEGSLRASSAAWLGAIAALLAGVLALAGAEKRENQQQRILALLIAASVSMQIGWALFGVLSGSRSGAVGALLIATNLELAVPLVVVSSLNWEQPKNRSVVGLALGVGSLMGLPPFGGFGGMVLVGQAAVNAGGVWLAVLLLGTGLVAAGWLRVGIGGWALGTGDNAYSVILTVPFILITGLAIAQLALFAMSGQLATYLTTWANLPWLTAP